MIETVKISWPKQVVGIRAAKIATDSELIPAGCPYPPTT